MVYELVFKKFHSSKSPEHFSKTWMYIKAKSERDSKFKALDKLNELLITKDYRDRLYYYTLESTRKLTDAEIIEKFSEDT